jgi:hypothetical protein
MFDVVKVEKERLRRLSRAAQQERRNKDRLNVCQSTEKSVQLLIVIDMRNPHTHAPLMFQQSPTVVNFS